MIIPLKGLMTGERDLKKEKKRNYLLFQPSKELTKGNCILDLLVQLHKVHTQS